MSGLDAPVLDGLLEGPGKKATSDKLSCSGIAVYAALKEALPKRPRPTPSCFPLHPPPSTIARKSGGAGGDDGLCKLLQAWRGVPERPGHRRAAPYRPANGESYDLDTAFVRRETDRVSEKIGLDGPLDAFFGEHEILDPRYFGGWGGMGGASTARSGRCGGAVRFTAPVTPTGGGPGCTGSGLRSIRAAGYRRYSGEP